MATNTQAIRGEWTSISAEARKRWHQLTDEDLRGVEGNMEELIARIQRKTGEGRDAIEGFVTELTSRGASAVSHAADSAGQYANQAGEQAREQSNTARTIAGHHPLETVLAALGIGLVAGLFVGLAGRGRS